MSSTRDVLHGRATPPRSVFIERSTAFAVAATGTFLAIAVAVVVRWFGFGSTMVVAALGAYGVLAAVALAAFEGTATVHPFGLANSVTLARGALNALLFGLVVQPVALEAARGEAAGWLFVTVALLSLALDGVDGWAARRWRTASSFGARFDVETDALLLTVLALAAVALGKVGPWVLGLALGYYAFLAARAVWPWLAAPLPPSRRRKTVFVAQAAGLVAIVAPPLPSAVAPGLAAAILALMTASFARDIAWLRRHGGAGSDHLHGS